MNTERSVDDIERIGVQVYHPVIFATEPPHVFSSFPPLFGTLMTVFAGEDGISEGRRTLQFGDSVG